MIQSRRTCYAKPEAKDAASGLQKILHRGRKYCFDTNSHVARQLGLHAEAACNADPVKVGGFVKVEGVAGAP